jgi:hypothetical protein
VIKDKFFIVEEKPQPTFWQKIKSWFKKPPKSVKDPAELQSNEPPKDKKKK